MIHQEAAESLLWEAPALVQGTSASIPPPPAASKAFALVQGGPAADGVIAEDRYLGLANFGAAGLAILFLVLLIAPLLFRKGQ